MPESKEERNIGYELLFILFLFLLIGWGVWIIYEYSSEFTKAVGDALIIAGILGLSIDPFIKRRLVKESLRSVDKLLIGYGLPPELQDRIKEIMRTRIVRQPMHIHYKLTLHNEKQVRVTTVVRYTLENISNEPYEFQQQLSAEKYNTPGIVRLCCIMPNGSPAYCWNEQELKERFLIEDSPDDPQLRARGEGVLLQPSYRNKDNVYKFYGECYQILPIDHTDSFLFGIPDIKTIHVIITGEYPEEAFTFGTTLAEAEDKQNPGKKIRWEGKRAFFTNESVSVWWEPKKAVAVTSGETKP